MKVKNDFLQRTDRDILRKELVARGFYILKVKTCTKLNFDKIKSQKYKLNLTLS